MARGKEMSPEISIGFEEQTSLCVQGLEREIQSAEEN